MKAILVLLTILSSSAMAETAKFSCNYRGDTYSLTLKSMISGNFREFFEYCRRKFINEEVCYRGAKNELNKIIERIDDEEVLGRSYRVFLTSQYRGTFSYKIQNTYVTTVSRPRPCHFPVEGACGYDESEQEVTSTRTNSIKRCKK